MLIFGQTFCYLGLIIEEVLVQSEANMQTRFITRFKKQDQKQKMFCHFQVVVKNLGKKRGTLNPQTTQVLIQQMQLVFGS